MMYPPVTRYSLRRICAALIAADLMYGGQVSMAASTDAVRYHVEAGDLEQALQAIQAQGRFTLSYDRKLTAQHRAPAVDGTLSADEALRQVLAGSGLEWLPVDGGFTLRRVVQGDHATELDAVQQVTIQSRKEQHPQRPVTAVSRLRGQFLSEQHIEDIQDLQYVVPGLYIQSTDSNDTQLTIRGVGDGGGQTSGDQNVGMPSSVATYVDNVYFPRPGIIRSLTDIDYVDVFKGPSGTLFGANATGGVVDIHTKEPSFQREGALSASYAQRNTSKVTAEVSGPINDSVAYRVTSVYAHSDGSVTNLEDDKRVNGYEREGLRAQLLVRPSDRFELKLSADYGQEWANPTRVIKSVTSAFKTTAAAIGATYVVGGRDTIEDDVTTTQTEEGGASAEATWKLADGYKLRSLSAFRLYHYVPQYADELSVPIYANSGTAVQDATITQDLRLESPRGKFFDYVAGLSYFKDNQNTVANTRYANSSIVTTYAGSGYAGLHIIRYGHLNDQASALYGRGTFHLSDSLDLQIGARATYDDRDARFIRLNKAAFDSGELRPHNVLPSATGSLNFQINDDWSSYVSFGYGQKAGGINVSAGAAKKAGYDSLILNPESTHNLEIGTLGTLIPNKLSLQADVFRTLVGSFQTQAYDETAASSYLMNAGNYRSQGVEAALRIQPIERLDIVVSGIVNDARYTNYHNALCPAEISAATCDLTGQRVFNAPRQVYAVSSRYNWDEGAFKHYVSARYSYRDWTYGTVDNSNYTRLPGYGLAAFTLGATRPTGSGNWDASLWVTNAFNKLYYTRLSGSSEVAGYVGDPRTVGVTLGYTFR